MASSKKQTGIPTEEETRAGFAERTEASPPPGMGDGGLNVVDENAEASEPDIVPPDAFEEDYGDLED